MTLSRDMIIAALLLGGFAIFGTGLLSIIDVTTEDKIAANQRAALLRSLNEVVPTSLYNNAIADDAITMVVPELGDKEELTFYRARLDGKAAATVLTAIAPDGYSGKITLLVGIQTNGEISGVRVVSHKETPGLGDVIEISKSDWVLGFNGKSLQNPERKYWKVDKDGGDFDSLTGATITPRAIVKAVEQSLLYFAENQELLFTRQVEATP